MKKRGKLATPKKKRVSKKNTPFVPSFSLHLLFFIFIGLLLLTPLLETVPSFMVKHINGLRTTRAQAASLVAIPMEIGPEKPVTIATESAIASTSAIPDNLGFCLYVPILMYHHVQPQNDAIAKGQTALSVDSTIFDQQMQYLHDNGYHVITTDEVAVALRSKAQLPQKSVVITLDDGYKDAYTYAFPVFKRLGITGSLMIAAGLVETPDYLTWADIEDMSKSGSISFSNHTWSHAGLGVIDPSVMPSEVDMAKNAIASHTGQSIDIFTYPYGSFNDTAVKFIQDRGYTAGISTIPGNYQCDSFLMTLHRIRIGNGNMADFGF